MPIVDGRCFCRGVFGVHGTMKFSFPSAPKWLSITLRSRWSLGLSRGRTLRCRECDRECESCGVPVARHDRLRLFSAMRGTCTVVPFNSAAVYASSEDMFSLRSNDGTCCKKKINISHRLGFFRSLILNRQLDWITLWHVQHSLFDMSLLTQGMTATQTRVSIGCLQTWSILIIAGRMIGLEISASRLHSYTWDIFRWWPICTAPDAETPPLGHTAVVLMRRQNI